MPSEEGGGGVKNRYVWGDRQCACEIQSGGNVTLEKSEDERGLEWDSLWVFCSRIVIKES